MNEFDIGTCLKPSMPLFKRVVVPIYDENSLMIGCTARVTDNSWPKWRDSTNLPKTDLLYNYWKARDIIKEKDSVIICESPGNLWRLYEASFKNAVALLGSSMSAAQFDLINKLGVSQIIIAMDNDKAGIKAGEDIATITKKLYKVVTVKLAESPFFGFNDIGEMTPEQVRELFQYFKID